MRSAVLLVPTLALALAWAAPAAAQDIVVTLLGTGTPAPDPARFGPSILVQAGREALVFDAGRGALVRLRQAGVSFGTITGLFLTHLHWDHTVGLPDLWLTGWLISHRATPLEIWGPPGTQEMATHLEAAYRYDGEIRASDDGAPASGGHLVVQEIPAGFVWERKGVRVTAIEVDHAPVKPAYGYRMDYMGPNEVGRVARVARQHHRWSALDHDRHRGIGSHAAGDRSCAAPSEAWSLSTFSRFTRTVGGRDGRAARPTWVPGRRRRRAGGAAVHSRAARRRAGARAR